MRYMPHQSETEITVDDAIAFLQDVECHNPILGVDVDVKVIPRLTSMFAAPGGYTEATIKVRYRTEQDEVGDGPGHYDDWGVMNEVGLSDYLGIAPIIYPSFSAVPLFLDEEEGTA